jgi:hypothetical protein
MVWLHWGWAQIEPHLTWISGLFGIVMAAWRWWDKREAVIWRRVEKLLEDEGKYLQDSCTYSLASILYPSPRTQPQQSVFAVNSLRSVFSRQWWHPLQKAAPIMWANHFLKNAHCELAEKDKTIASHRSFATAQRYSAFVLEGALTAAYANCGQDDQSRNRANQAALDKFNAALALEGKVSDTLLLELKALQLRKLGRPQEAAYEFNRLQTLVEARLQGGFSLQQKEKSELLVRLLRVVRYQSEMDHQANPNGTAANHRLLGLIQNPLAKVIFGDHLEFQNLLERAHYHEVHACVRVRVTGRDAAGAVTLPNNGVAQQSLAAAKADYDALSGQVSSHRFSWPIKLWRWINRADKKDGTLRLRIAASEGLRSLDQIAAGEGCQYCRPKGNGAGFSIPLIAPRGSEEALPPSSTHP